MPPTNKPSQRPPTPAAFLRSLGIRRRNTDSDLTNSFWRAVRRAGGNRDDIAYHGGFSPEAGSVYYITEQIGKRVLSTEYDSLLRYLRYFDRIGASQPPLRRIADIGGGTGIVSMYLAACHSGCKATVYDHSPAQLALGKKWAKEQNLRGVRFAHATYVQLASQVKSGCHDLVLFLRGMNMKLPAPDSGDLSLKIPNCRARRPNPDVQSAINAVARLLSPEGIGVIACVWSGWGLVTLFEAIRRAGLGVDWHRNQCRKEEVEGRKRLVDALIVVRLGLPRLATSSQEEAKAFLISSRFPDGPRVIPGKVVDTGWKRISGGTELLRANGHRPIDGVQTIRLVQKDGLLLLQGLSLDGTLWGKAHTLSGIGELLNDAQQFLDEWQKDLESSHHFKIQIHPRLTRFIRYHQKA